MNRTWPLVLGLLLLAPRAAFAQQAATSSHAEVDADVELPDGRAVNLHAETEDPSRSVVLRLRVPPPAPQPLGFDTIYFASLEGYGISAMIGAGLGMLLGWGIGGDDATSIISGGLVGATFTGVLGCGIALGQLHGGPPNAAVWPTIFAPFVTWPASMIGAIGPLARPDPDVLAASLIAFGASAVIAPLVSALIYNAVPPEGAFQSKPNVRVGLGTVYGTF